MSPAAAQYNVHACIHKRVSVAVVVVVARARARSSLAISTPTVLIN